MNTSLIIKQSTEKAQDSRSQFYQTKKLSHLLSTHYDYSYCNISTKYTKTQNSFDEKQKKFIKYQNKKPKGFKFGNQPRFLKSNSDYEDICQINIPDRKSSLASSIGFGKRHPISKVILRRAIETPSPDQYDYQSLNLSQHKRGRSFMESDREKQQANRYVDFRKDVYSPHFSQNNPSYIYNIRERLDQKPVTMGKKLKMYTQKMSHMYSHVPGPRYNFDQRKLSNIGGVQMGHSFTSGTKQNLAKALNNNPGCQYNIAGFCDKFVKIKKKLNIDTKKKKIKYLRAQSVN